MGDFEIGLCDCFNDCGICFCSFCCTPCQFGKNMEVLKSQEWCLGDSCFVNCLVMYLMYGLGAIPGCIMSTMARQAIRKKTGAGADDHFVGDLFTVCCCLPCAVAQEAQHVHAPAVGCGGDYQQVGGH